jgi:predicted dithiol-disulfide oxidoreductase (DUF899 family)
MSITVNHFTDVRHVPLFSMSKSDPSEVVDRNLTFASRNPIKNINPARVRHRPKLTDAQKVSADTKREINRENADALQVELVNFFEFRREEVTRLAKKFNKSEAKVKQLLGNESNYKNSRAPSLRNALVYAKGIEMNEGK